MTLSNTPKETVKQTLIKFAMLNNLKFPENENGFNFQDEITMSIKNSFHSLNYSDFQTALSNYSNGESEINIRFRLDANSLGRLIREQKGANQQQARQTQNRYKDAETSTNPKLVEEIMNQGYFDALIEWTEYRTENKPIYLKRLSTLHSWMENRGKLLSFNQGELELMTKELKSMVFELVNAQNSRKRYNPFAQTYNHDFTDIEYEKAAQVALTLDAEMI
jgi:hypothetical protein